MKGWRSLEEVGDTATSPVCVDGVGKRVFFVFFLKTKNGILKGLSQAIFGRAKGKSI